MHRKEHMGGTEDCHIKEKDIMDMIGNVCLTTSHQWPLIANLLLIRSRCKLSFTFIDHEFSTRYRLCARIETFTMY